ncbi:hypothetical protein MFAL_00180 [Mycolicibacterium fallax]|nr:hypothetical protein MFAL_00180 [Mycolicibacterium fallax]
MQRPARFGELDQRRGLRGRLGDVLGPGLTAITVFDGDGVLSGTFAKQLLQRFGHRNSPDREQICKSVYHVSGHRVASGP